MSNISQVLTKVRSTNTKMAISRKLLLDISQRQRSLGIIDDDIDKFSGTLVDLIEARYSCSIINQWVRVDICIITNASHIVLRNTKSNANFAQWQLCIIQQVPSFIDNLLPDDLYSSLALTHVMNEDINILLNLLCTCSGRSNLTLSMIMNNSAYHLLNELDRRMWCALHFLSIILFNFSHDLSRLLCDLIHLIISNQSINFSRLLLLVVTTLRINYA
jgi:hypothetical protein